MTALTTIMSRLRARRAWCAECGSPILGERHSYRTCSSACEDAIRNAMAQL